MPRHFKAIGFCLTLAATTATAENTAPPAEEVLAPYAAEIAENIDWISPALAVETLEKSLRFVEFVTYHEIAHMLITELSLPVLGWEEDAADTLAVAMLLGNETDDTLLALSAATQAWAMNPPPPADLAPEAFYGEHSLSLQRAYHAACLMVGRNPQRFGPLADIMRMPGDRRQRCAWQSKRALDGWTSVLDPHRRAEDDPAQTIHWNYAEPDPGLQYVLAAAFSRTGFLQQIASLVSGEFNLPRSASLEARPCGAVRAFYDPAPNQITICYEFLQQHFLRFALYDADKAGLVTGAVVPPDVEDLPLPDAGSGFDNTPLGDGNWSISISTDGGVRAVTSDGRLVTTRSGTGGDTRIHQNGQRSCPGAGTWPTCY